MSAKQFEQMTRGELEHLLQRQKPDNESESTGYALVNVLQPESFEEEHIPGSINIPADQPDRFEDRFAKDKEIVLYCASESCDASPTAARRLVERGFSKVYDYEAGMKGWKDADNPVEEKAA